MSKTPQMELIEERDAAQRGGEKRDIRAIIADAYERSGKLDRAAAMISERYGTSLAFGTLSDWIERLEGSIHKTLIFREAPGVDVDADPSEAYVPGELEEAA